MSYCRLNHASVTGREERSQSLFLGGEHIISVIGSVSDTQITNSTFLFCTHMPTVLALAVIIEEYQTDQ